MVAGVSAGCAGVAVAQALWLKQMYVPLPAANGQLSGGCRTSGLAQHSPLLQAVTRRLSSGALRRDGKTAPPPRAHNILFVGDSLVTGVGCSEEGGARGPGVPRAIAEYCARHLEADVRWSVIAETGFNVAMLHSELLPAVAREARAAEEGGQRIDMVVLICGLPDFKQAFTGASVRDVGARRQGPGGFRYDLGAFVDDIHHTVGVQCAVVLPALNVNKAPVFDGLWPLTPLVARIATLWDDQKQRLVEELQHTARDGGRRVAFVPPGEEDWWSLPRYWAVDGIHPNDEGQRIWGEHIAAHIVRRHLLQNLEKDLQPASPSPDLAPATCTW